MMPTRNVVLTDRQHAMVESLVREGRYQNASEVMREGIRLLEEREARDCAKLAALKVAVSLGREDIEAGRYIDLEAAEIEAYVLEIEHRSRIEPAQER